MSPDATRCRICRATSVVLYGRLAVSGKYSRRRCCLRCGFRWTTVEIEPEFAP